MEYHNLFGEKVAEPGDERARQEKAYFAVGRVQHSQITLVWLDENGEVQRSTVTAEEAHRWLQQSRPKKPTTQIWTQEGRNPLRAEWGDNKQRLNALMVEYAEEDAREGRKPEYEFNPTYMVRYNELKQERGDA
jgi:hypothetical protein